MKKEKSEYKTEDGGLDGALGSEVATGQQVGAVCRGIQEAIIHGVAVYRGAKDPRIAEVPGEVDSDGWPEAAGIDVHGSEEQCAMHGYGDGADDGGTGGTDVEGDKDHCEDQYSEIAAEPFFGQAEEDADDQDFGDGRIDEGIPEVGKEGQKGAGSGDGKDMGEILDEDDGGGESAAEQDAAGQESGDVSGGELGDGSLFVLSVEKDVDGTNEEGEDGTGDRVSVRLGKGGQGQEGLGSEHGGEADAEGQGEADHEAG